MVSKQGMEPSSLNSSIVNWMEGSTELMCLKKSPCVTDVVSQSCHQHTSSISWGCSAVEMALF